MVRYTIIAIFIFCLLSCSINKKYSIQVIYPYIRHQTSIGGGYISKTTIEFDNWAAQRVGEYSHHDTSYVPYSKKLYNFTKKLPNYWYDSAFKYYCSIPHPKWVYTQSNGEDVLREQVLRLYMIPSELERYFKIDINIKDTNEIIKSHLVDPSYKIIAHKKNKHDTIYVGGGRFSYDIEMIKCVNKLYGNPKKLLGIIRVNDDYYLIDNEKYLDDLIYKYRYKYYYKN